MKTLRNLIILGAIISLASCTQTSLQEQAVSATFQVNTPATKTLGDGTSATMLAVRVYDAKGRFLKETVATAQDDGWNVTLMLVEGTYSFSFWAYSQDADAFSVWEALMTVDYSKMDMNGDAEDAFWGSVQNKEVNNSFTQNITLSRPFAQLEVLAGDIDQNIMSGAVSAFKLEGDIPTVFNLITGETSSNAASVAYEAAAIPGNEIDGQILVAATYMLAPQQETILSSVNFRVDFSDRSYIDLTAQDVPVCRNHKTIIKDN